ncbi:MAG: hypothetical protein K9L23_20055 [Desulfotignum sp.]|nr:hypothetical protein [Desulfotignum sp.]MCF8126859.1 hypothetical protein [Desulfotignum sp.]
MENNECQTFQGFLNEAVKDNEEIRRLQEFMGYCLVKRAGFPNYLVLFGNSRSKAVFLDVVTRLVGFEKCSFEALALDIYDFAPLLRRSALNIAKIGDLDLNACRPVLHTIVGGDPCNARDDDGTSIVFIPTCKLIFSHPGSLADISMPAGVRARILPVTFRADPPAHFTPDMMTGVRSFAIEGWWRLFERGRFERPSVLFPPVGTHDSNKSFQD